MATTYTDASFGVRAIGARTDNVGAAVTDMTAAEDRFAQIAFSEGVLLPKNSFLPAPGTGWGVDFGSGGTKSDYMVVAGDTQGQGNYLVQLPADTTVTINASDPSLDRIDQIYLVVQDNAYDSSSRALARFAYRDGTASGSPVAPGPDGGWEAFVLLAEIDIPGGAASIAGCTVTDKRTFAGLKLGDATVIASNLAGHTVINTPSGGVIQLHVGGTAIATIDIDGMDLQGNDLDNVGNIGGVPIGTHDHDGVSSAVVSHLDLTDTATGDPHGQYVLESELDGLVAGIPAGSAATADKLTTARSIGLTGDATGSVNFDGSANVTITVTVVNDSHTHDTRYYTESEINTIADQHFGYYNAAASTTPGKITKSTSGPSGGADGDIWLQYA